MRTNFRKKFFYLQLYCAISTLLLGSLFVFGFTSQKKQKFSEIDVERINVVEKDGKLKMVIANKARRHPGIVDGIYFKDREGQRPAGMTFFSEKGDEIGGISFDGDTGKGQSGSLAFDKFRGDQTIQITHSEDKNGDYFAGLRVNDQNMPLSDYIARMEEVNKLPNPEEAYKASMELRSGDKATVSRMIIGKSKDKSSVIEMNDGKGKPRIKISVQKDGNPKLEFLDENGKMIYSLPEDAKAKK